MRNVLAKLPGLDKVTPDGLKPQGYLGPAPEFNYTKKDPNNPKQCASRLICSFPCHHLTTQSLLLLFCN